MEFGINSIEDGWFKWYVRDKVQKVELTASRYDAEDFVKKLLINLTEIIRNNQEKNIFSFFSEPGFVTIKMKIEDKDMFTMELACSDNEIHISDDITCAKKYNIFTISMFYMRAEFVPTILKSFQYYQRSHLMLDYYEENWTVAIGGANSEKFSFPFKELQELHQIASDIK